MKETAAGDRFSEPIVEGESIAGIKVGDVETAIYKFLVEEELVLAYAEMNPMALEGLKRIDLVKKAEKGSAIFTFYVENKKIVIIILTSSTADGETFYKGKTTKGLALGNSFEQVEKLYGKPTKKWGGNFWYKDEGIMFSSYYGGETVSTVLIADPSYDMSSLLRRMGAPESD